MATPLAHPSLSCCHAYASSSPIRTDGIPWTFKPLPPRSSATDNMDSNRQWEGHSNNIFHQCDIRNKRKTYAMMSSAAPDLAKMSFNVDGDNNSSSEDKCLMESVSNSINSKNGRFSSQQSHMEGFRSTVPRKKLRNGDFGSMALEVELQISTSKKWKQDSMYKSKERSSLRETRMISLQDQELALMQGWDSLEAIPSVETFISILQYCRRKKHLGHTKLLLIHIHGNGLERLVDLGNNLVATLIECGSMSFALQVFHKQDTRTEYSWTYIIRGFTDLGELDGAIYAFQKMKEDYVEPSKYTFVAILKACARAKCLAKGEEVYLQIVKLGFESDYFIGNTMVDLYSKCGALTEAKTLFSKLRVTDAVSWTALISGYMEKGLSQEACECLDQMQAEGVLPDAVTFVGGLRACYNIGDEERGQILHAQVATEEFEEDPFIGNALVDMYVKFGLLEEAEDVFSDLLTRDVFSWTALVSGFVEHGQNDKAVNCYWQMQEQGQLPNSMTCTSVLKACSKRADQETGQRIHAQVQSIAQHEPLEIIIATTLIDMYAKCINMVSAQNVFDTMPSRDLVGWNALITGYSRQGKTEIIFELFERIMSEGILPDEVTFLCVLTTCSRAGLVRKGYLYFDALTNGNGLIPTIKHYNCMVDLLGRAGHLKDAMAMLRSMPFLPDLVAWATLLAACRKWGDVEMGRQAFESTLRLDSNNIAAYNAMFNLYVDANMWDEAKKIETMKINLVERKLHTKNYIQIGGSIHTFV